MRSLITGINGFVGSHLANYLINKGEEVYGTIRNRSSKFNLDYFGITNSIHFKECELMDATNVDDVILNILPNKIYHLAAQSFVPTSWKSPGDTLMNNILPEVNIFEAIRKYVPDCKILIAGSSEEYGLPSSSPITELHALKPLSPYGVSKVTQDVLGCQYAKSYGLKIVVTRAFNHTGTLRHENFVSASFAKQVAKLSNGSTIKVGNLKAVRDFTDVNDMIRAYDIALENDNIEYGTPYNISSQIGYKIQFILEELIKISGKEFNIEQDPERMRPSDINELIGDSSKFRKNTGWSPKISFSQTLEDMYNYYKNN